MHLDAATERSNEPLSLTLSTGRDEGKGLEKGPCKPVELEKKHEKGPRGSWAGSHTGNPR
jgi:hypothetical protein